MRRRSESLGGNEALLSKARDHERVRPPKWTPDDRETWKPKERWANGPDNSKRWLDVPTTGRQKRMLCFHVAVLLIESVCVHR